MNTRLIVAFTRGYNGLTTHEMHEALWDAQQDKNRRYSSGYWPPLSSSLEEGSLFSYALEEGIEIDMRAKRISDMPYDKQGNFIRIYMPGYI